MRKKICKGLILYILLSYVTIVNGSNIDYPYQDTRLSVKERVDDLLSRMTIDEKILQLSMKSLKQLKIDENGEITEESLKKLFKGQSIGCLESPFVEHEKIARLSAAADKYLRENTRLGIPAIQIGECLHGQLAVGTTIFPQAISEGSTWNPGLIHTMGEIIAKEASSSGVDQALSPLFDLAIDPRYGRVEECYGEDPFLVSEMGKAFVTGVQGDPKITKYHIPKNHLMCTAKHFVAYSIPQAGINIAPSVVGERDLRSLYLEPFEKVVKEANIYSLMPGYQEVDGVPVHANKWLLKDILRGEWGFKGYIFSDYTAIEMLHSFHYTASSKKEAAMQAISAGVDLEAPSQYAYGELKELIKNGELEESVVDSAVNHVLTAKFKAGLFDNIYTVPKNRSSIIHTKKNIAHALKIAEESIILLKNQNKLLPLDRSKLKSIAVIGPNADQVQFGDYSATKSNDYGITLLEGIKQIAEPKVKVNYAKGCGITNLDKSGFSKAVEVAKKSDVVVLAIGGTSIIYSGIGWGNDKNQNIGNTCGEGYDRSTLTPPGVQTDLIRAICATGKPVILVMIHGRSYSIPWEKKNIPSIIEAWYPGEQGGTAIANILFGKVNPSGKLPVTVPVNVGHIPNTATYKPSARGFYHKSGTPDNPGRDYVFSSPEPLFCFGYGLSYTQFKYSNLKIENKEIHPGQTINLSLEIKNIGKVTGKEVVQLYLNDKYSSVTTPVKVLKGFSKIELKPEESKKVEFKVNYDELSLWNQQMEKVVEPGEFEVMIGSSSEDIRLKDNFTVVKK